MVRATVPSSKPSAAVSVSVRHPATVHQAPNGSVQPPSARYSAARSARSARRQSGRRAPRVPRGVAASVRAHLHGDRALRRRGHERRGVEAESRRRRRRARGGARRRAREAGEAGGGEDDRVELPFGERPHARGHVAAQQPEVEVGPRVVQQRAAAGRRRADARPRGERKSAPRSATASRRTSSTSAASIRSGTAAITSPGGIRDGTSLYECTAASTLPFEQRRFQLAHEDAERSDVGERPVGHAVARGRDDHQLGFMPAARRGARPRRRSAPGPARNPAFQCGSSRLDHLRLEHLGSRAIACGGERFADRGIAALEERLDGGRPDGEGEVAQADRRHVRERGSPAFRPSGAAPRGPTRRARASTSR